MVKVKPNLTGAGYGLSGWLQQRITAIIMLVFTLAFLFVIFNLATNVDASIASWRAVLGNFLVKIFVQVFFIALLLHAWVGIRDLWMDYVKSCAVKLTLYTLTILWLFGSLLYSIKVIWAF